MESSKKTLIKRNVEDITATWHEVDLMYGFTYSPDDIPLCRDVHADLVGENKSDHILDLLMNGIAF